MVEIATEARQSVTGHSVRYVLFVGLTGATLAYALIYAVVLGGGTRKD